MKSLQQWLEMIRQKEFGKDNTEGKKELVVMVGPPAIGKSTYVAAKYPRCSVVTVSKDDIVDSVARDMGLTYDDMFAAPPKETPIGEDVPGMEKLGSVVRCPSWMPFYKNCYERVARGNRLINDMLESSFRRAVTSGKHVVVDMTNMNAAARSKALAYAEGHDFFRRAVVFTMEDSDLPALIRRMEERAERARKAGWTKTIGEDVLTRMISSYQAVSPAEGFDRVDAYKSFQPMPAG
ncbi:MAG: AAA family ATPase [Minisyncoccia bacterium]